MRLLEQVERALAGFGVTTSDGVVCACSHGPDSLALADALIAIHPKVSIVYVHHGLRPEADDEARRVLGLGAAARVVEATVGGGRGPEEAARRARYRALDAVADEVGARWIALGHTASDQAETVLMRLLRGAGPVGLAGIPARRGRYIRPLLRLWRRDVEAYLAERGLTPSQDGSNASMGFLRNRVRQAILPVLRAENPNLDEALARTAAAIREVADGLDWAAGQALPQVARAEGRLDAAALAALPPAVAKRLLARLIPALEARHLEAVLALAGRSAGSQSLDLPGLSLRREYGELLVAPEPGVAHLTVDGPDAPYLVRRWQPGDRMRPAALAGRSRKLQDLFTDRKVPRRERVHALVVVRERDGEIMWAQHVGDAMYANLRVTLTTPNPAVSL